MRRGALAVEVLAQAKINLRLKILAREASGFHQIETLFLRLVLADTVRVRRTSGACSLDVTGDVDLALLGPAEQNLGWRAAKAYLEATGGAGGFAIEIEKHIPIGGGLGGGSADAGAVLRAFDAASDTPLGEIGLMSIAARLGSDVPFLTATTPYALAWGRGERMLALSPPEPRGVSLIIPGTPVNTASAYGWLATDRAESGITPGSEPMLSDVNSLSDWDVIAALAENDFEPVVGRRHEEISSLLAALRGAPFDIMMMSGSGSTMFGVHRGNSVRMAMASTSGNGAPAHRFVQTTTATRVEPVTPID